MEKRGGGVSRFYVKVFLSHSAENFRTEIIYCCINFGYRKSLDKRGGGGVSRASVEIFLSHTAEKVRRGTLLCFTKLLVPKNLWIRGEEEGGVSGFSVEKFFVSECPKNFVGERFSVSLNSGIEKIYA